MYNTILDSEIRHFLTDFEDRERKIDGVDAKGPSHKFLGLQ